MTFLCKHNTCVSHVDGKDDRCNERGIQAVSNIEKTIFYYALDQMIGGILFLSCLSLCLFVYLFVCLSVLREVSIEHLQRVRHANRGRLLLRTPGPVPLWDLHVF